MENTESHMDISVFSMPSWFNLPDILRQLVGRSSSRAGFYALPLAVRQAPGGRAQDPALPRILPYGVALKEQCTRGTRMLLPPL